MDLKELYKKISFPKIIAIIFMLSVAYSSYQLQVAETENRIEQDRRAAERRKADLEHKRQTEIFQRQLREKRNRPNMNGMNKTYEQYPSSQNEYDMFDEYLDDFLSDPEDELAYPPEIFDALMDEDEDEYTQPDFEY